jgi:hypothetical protein
MHQESIEQAEILYQGFQNYQMIEEQISWYQKALQKLEFNKKVWYD